MVGHLEELLVVIGGAVLIVLLSWILALVHKQTLHLQELERQLHAKDNVHELKEKK